MAKKTKKNPFKDQEESNWHPAEIRRRDIQRLLENTKKLAGMYGDLLQIKREGWENVLRARAKKAEKEKQNG